MIKSMTGFGRTKLVKDLREYQVEMKSVNHKYSDINIKLPRSISYLEEDIRKIVLSKVKRGKIEVFITFDNYSDEGKNIIINKEIAKVYINNLKELADEENISSNIEVTEISKLPDVLTIKNVENEEKIKEEIVQAVTEATEKLVNMRKIEGKKIATDLLNRINNIDVIVKEISQLSTGLIEEYVVKLENRIKEILKTDQVDKTRLAQEVVIYSDKCSIEEELTRLNSHIAQFKDLLNSEDAIGKKLDFLIQEMNRETNTIGSKSVNLDITNKVIDIKTILEDIREQIQNIE
mgnify:FL=1